MNELISIVVTSYNHVEFLQQRMDSLLEQTYQNIEILVIDDASIDGSQDFLKIYERNPKVKLFLFEKNVGYVNASNFGVSMTQGEYIVFAECDDFAEPEQIELLFKAIKKQGNIGVSYCRSKLLEIGRAHV